MTPYEQDDIRSILRRVYSQEIVSRWNINERVAETLEAASAGYRTQFEEASAGY